MASGWRSTLVGSRWVWLLALALVATPVVAEFVSRLSISRQLIEEEARLKHGIEIERARAEVLQTFEALVRTDAYVEWWARVEARMVRPGEVSVVPIAPHGETPALASDASQTVRDYPSEWWAAFFADLP